MTKPFNPWHDVTPFEDENNTGKLESDTVIGLIEIPKGTRAKYEVDKKSGLLKLDRVLYSSVHYPANYGFIPQSYCGDGDPLDILVLSQIDFVPMCLVPAKIIGVMRMIDNGESDDKVIAVSAGDPSVKHINDISELPAHFITELRTFFEDYSKLEKENVLVESFLNKEEAMQIVQESLDYYQKEFVKVVQ